MVAAHSCTTTDPSHGNEATSGYLAKFLQSGVLKNGLQSNSKIYSPVVLKNGLQSPDRSGSHKVGSRSELAGACDGSTSGDVRSIDGDSVIFAFPDAFENNTSIDGDSLRLQSVHVLMSRISSEDLLSAEVAQFMGSGVPKNGRVQFIQPGVPKNGTGAHRRRALRHGPVWLGVGRVFA